MIDSILEKALQLRLLAIDITNCEYYGEDDAVLGNLVPADIVSALDDLTESLRKELAEIEKQEPYGYLIGSYNEQPLTNNITYAVLSKEGPDGSMAIYTIPVQQSPAVSVQRITEQDAREILASYSAYVGADAEIFIDAWLNTHEGKALIAKASASTDSGVKI